MSRKHERNEKKKFTNNDSSDSDDGEIDGIRTAADQLTLSPALLDIVPKNIREWTSKDTQAWLREIFEGSDDLDSYVGQFGKFGIRGIDLLSMTEKELVEFGITHAIHINRAKTSIAQLIVYQQALDRKLKKEQKLREKEKPYYDLMLEANNLRERTPPYQSPFYIKYWKAVDVYLWLEAKENVNQLGVFLKPFALERISGKELLEMLNKDEDHFHEICRSLKQRLTPVDIQRLKDAIMNKKKYYEELNKKIKETKLKEMEKSVPKIDTKKPPIKSVSILGSGNFGIIYSAIYKNQHVVLKRVKMKSSLAAGEEGKDPSMKPNLEENHVKPKVETEKQNRLKEEQQQHQKLFKLKEEALLREAFMMAKCSGKGVVRLIGQAEVKETRLIAMEFMSGHSVEQEIIRASKDDGSVSIFHPQHKDNLDLLNRVGVDDPVLYQILRIGRDVASALARIHSLGVIHLDIAARNILLDRDKRPKITDFGMARLESDMIEQSSYRAALIDEAAAKNMSSVERDLYLKWDHHDRKMSDLDATEEDLILEIFEGEVPVAWMPIWTLVDKKIVDRHWDVYSFGCFLYEMAMRQPPFQGLSRKDMFELKQSIDTHPKLSPLNFPVEFIEIITQTWTDYEHQPLMPAIYDRITALHKSVVSATSSTSTNYEYMAMKDSLGVPNQPTSESIYSAAPSVNKVNSVESASPSLYARPSYSSTASYSRPSLSAYSAPYCAFPAPNPVQTDLYSAALKYNSSPAKSTPNDAQPSETPSVPPLMKKFMIPKRVRLSIDPNDLEGPKDIDKQILEEMLDCALNSQDYIFIIEIMQRIPANDDELQIDVICKCFHLLKAFAEDNHMASQDDEVWKHIIERILLKLSEANQTQNEAGPLLRSHLLRLTVDGTAAIASLLKGKHWSEEKDFQSLPTVGLNQLNISSPHLRYLCSMLSFNLKSFSEESAEICRYSCAAIGILAIDSDPVRDQFYRDGTLKLIMKALIKHTAQPSTVKEAFSAIRAFYLNQILHVEAFSAPVTRNQAPIDPQTIMDSWKLFPSVFFDCLRYYLRSDPAASSSILDDVKGIASNETDESVVQVILQVVLDISNNGMKEFEELEKLFVNMTNDDFRLLLLAVQRYSQNFRIQEGGYGVFAAMLQTGHEPPVIRISANVDPTIVAFVLPHPQRVSIFVENPSNLDHLLSVMENFSVDDKIAIGIRKDQEENSKQQQEYYSRGLYFTGTSSRSAKKKSAASSSGYGGEGAGGYGGSRSNYYSSLNDSPRKNNKNNGDNNQFGRDLLLEEFTEKMELHFDDEGNHISAAILQKSAAIIIGVASMAYPTEVPALLYRTRYNELILQALKNFKSDVDLTHFAFIALYYTCRKNTMHQVFLNELAITKHLYGAVVRFQWACEDMPDSLVLILEGATGGLVGLLEPQEDRTGTANPINFSILKKTAALALEREMGSITVNKDSASFKYCQELAEYLSREDKQKFTELEKIAFLLLKLRDPVELNLPYGEEGHDWHSVYVMYFKLIGTLLFWCPGVLQRWKQLFVLYLQRDENGDFMLLGENYRIVKYGLYPFVMKILSSFGRNSNTQALHPNVLAAALSLLTSVSRQVIGDKVLFGEESSNISIFENGKEDTEARDELLSYCLLSSKEHYHHPILIRYSLWLMIFLIAGRNEESSSSSSAAATEKKVDLESNRDVAAEIALSNGIEWAIEAMKAFPEYYSIQCLAILFLIWMEKRGHFAKRKLSLVTLRELLQSIIDSSGSQQFRTLEEEGHDTSLIGRSIYMFGDLVAHADRLYRLIDSHLMEKEQIVHDSWDGITRPLRIEAIRFEKEEDPSGRVVDVFIIEVTWENRFDATTHSYQPFRWKVTKRHATFAQFQRDMLKQFPSLPPLFSEVTVVPKFGRIVKLLFSRSPEFLEKRRLLMNKSFEELNKVRATLFNPVLLSYLEVDRHIQEMRSGRALPAIPIRQAEFPVNDMKIDEEEGLVFVATGTPYSIFQNTSSQLRGCAIVYRIIFEDLRGDRNPRALPAYRLEEVTKLSFTFGVQSIAWDRSRRCVALGFSMGLISYFSFASGSNLVYVGEQDYHTDVITDLQFVPRERKLFLEYEMQMLLVAVSQGSRVTIVDMKDGGVISQIAKAWNGARLVSCAVDTMDSVLILGTEQGSILTYDFSSTTPQLLASLSFNHATSNRPKDPGIPLNNKGPVYVTFANAQRLVYAAHHNKIFICKVAVRSESSNRLVLWKTLTLAQGIQITAVKLIHYDQRLVVTCGNGSVVIYDMSEPQIIQGKAIIVEGASPIAGAIIAASAIAQEGSRKDLTAGGSKGGVVLVSGHDASAKLNNEYATSASNLLPWNEVVRLKESALRDWLRGKGEVASKIYSRTGLLLAVLEKAGQTLQALANAVAPQYPHADVLFAYRFGSNREKSTLPIMKTIVMMEANQTIWLGGNDGFISRYSLLDFYPPFHGSDIHNQKLVKTSALTGDVLSIFTTSKTTKTSKYQCDA